MVKKIALITIFNILLNISSPIFFNMQVIAQENTSKIQPVTDTNNNAMYQNEQKNFRVKFGDKKDETRHLLRFEAVPTITKNLQPDTASETKINNLLNQRPFLEKAGDFVKKIISKEDQLGIELSLIEASVDDPLKPKIATQSASVSTPSAQPKNDLELSPLQQNIMDNLNKQAAEISTESGRIGFELDKTKAEIAKIVTEARKIYAKTELFQENGKDIIKNAEVVEGVNVKYQIIEGKGVKEEIILKPSDNFSSECLKDLLNTSEVDGKGCSLPKNTYTFSLKLDPGVQINQSFNNTKDQPAGIWYFTDSYGRYLAHFLPPFALDENKVRTDNVKMVIIPKSQNEYTVTLTLDLKWLLSPDRLFPVIIDPTVIHDTTAEFAAGTLNRVTDTGSGSSPTLETYYQELSADINTRALYHFSSGVCTVDDSGNTYTLTANGGMTCTTGGRFGYKASGFATTPVSYSQATVLDVALTQGTIEAWINPANLSATQTVIYAGSTNDTYITVGTSGQVTLSTSASTALSTGNNLISASTWTHVAAAWTSIGHKIYINGIEQATDTNTTTHTSQDYTTYIGVGAGGNTNAFSGSIDEVKISTIARTPEEIKLDAQRRPYGVYTSDVVDFGQNTTSFNSLSWTENGVQTGDGETPNSSTSLTAQWNFNETSGTTAANNAGASSCGGTGTNCDFTLNNFASTASQDQAAGTGWTANNKKWGVGAIMLSSVATADSLSRADPASNALDPNSADMTIETWIKTNDTSAEIFSNNNANGTACTNNGYYWGIDSSGYPVFNLDTNGATAGCDGSITGTIKVNDGNWHHLAVSVTRGTSATMYLDAVAIGTDSSITSYSSTTVAGVVYIGGSAGGYDGVLDSTRFYSRALAANEILSNYQAGNIEFQTRVGGTSAPDATWEAWKPTTSETQIDSMDTSSEKWGVDSYQNSSSTINKISGVDTGNGADSACIMDNGTKTLDTTAGSSVCNGSGRSTAYAVNFSDTTLEMTGETSVTVSTTPTGLLAGDEVLIINLQGTSTNYNGVGQYETHIISSISTNTLNFTDYPLRNSYDGTTQKIMIQRVPNFGSVTVCGGNTGGGCTAAATLTATTWNGTKNGVLFFRSTGTVTVNSGGTISANALGYRGASGVSARLTTGTQGEDSPGVGASATKTANGSAGGGGGYSDNGGGGARACGGGGGGYGVAGSAGGNPPCAGGTSSGGNRAGAADLTQLMLGGAGGSGGTHVDTGGYTTSTSGAGGNGGGIIFIAASTVTISGSISANGANGSQVQTTGSGTIVDGNGGGGAGGSIYISSSTATLGSSLVTSNAGTGAVLAQGGSGGNGAVGRIAVYYTSSLSGTTTPVAYTQKLQSQVKAEGTGALQLAVGAPQVDSATVALWHLEETSGTSAYIKDSTTNALNGTPTGTTVVNGFFGKARSFNGSSDYVNVPDNASLDITTNITIEAWVNHTVAESEFILSKRISGSDDAYELATCDTPLGEACFAVYIGNTRYVIQADEALTLSQWHHVVGTYDGSNLKIYVNGVLKNSTARTGSIDSTADAVRIGWGYDNNYTWTGSIDEVRISNTARTAEEVAEAYRAGRDHRISRTITSTDLSAKTKLPFYVAADRPGTYLEATIGESAYANYESDANTVGLWRLEEQSGSGAYIKDNSGVGNHGTPTGTTFVQGKLGKARSFNGSSDYVSVVSTSSLNPTSAISISAWINASTISGTDQIVAKYGTGANDRQYALELDDGILGMYIRKSDDSNWAYAVDTVAVSIGSWYHVVGTFDGNYVRVYKNGVLVGISTQYAGTINSGTGKPVQIGGFSGNYFNGTIDEPHISNSARTADNIRQAYEIGKRTHPVTIDFATTGLASNLLADSSDLSFDVATTSGLFKFDKVIVKENVNGTEYIAQGDVSGINTTTRTVTVVAWDSGSTFPATGYTASATVFKWQKEWFDLTGSLSTHRDAITRLTTRITDGSQGANFWLDDFRYGGAYLTNPAGETITSSTGLRYFQYRAILSSTDTNVTPQLTSVTTDYSANSPPSTPAIQNYKYFDNAKINDTTPAFNFKSTDADSDDVGYEIQIDNDNLFGSLNLVAESSTSSGFLNTENGGDTHPFTQNQTISFTVQAGDALTNGTTYWYRLRAKDPGGSNTWSSWLTQRSFTIDTTLTRDEWFQTTKEQFDTDTKSGVKTNSGGYVELDL